MLTSGEGEKLIETAFIAAAAAAIEQAPEVIFSFFFFHLLKNEESKSCFDFFVANCLREIIVGCLQWRKFVCVSLCLCVVFLAWISIGQDLFFSQSVLGRSRFVSLVLRAQYGHFSIAFLLIFPSLSSA